MYGTDLRTFWHRAIHFGQGVSTGGPKVRKNFEFFTISTLYVHISQKVLKIEAYKQHTGKSFVTPLSNCRMCLDPSVTGFYRVSQNMSDVIPVLIGTCEASRFYSNLNRTSRLDSIRFESDGPIRKFRIAVRATFAVVP